MQCNSSRQEQCLFYFIFIIAHNQFTNSEVGSVMGGISHSNGEFLLLMGVNTVDLLLITSLCVYMCISIAKLILA